MQITDNRRAVQRVLWITLGLNLIVALGKIIIGVMSGALAITADGFHSLVDSSGNIVGLIATRFATLPPDEDHPYGHRRFETLAALFIGAFLLITAWEIARGALDRLQGGEPPTITPLTFVVLIATLIININVNRYQVKEGKRLRSEILVADAANTGSDIFVTLSVLVSMALIAAFGWVWADIVAALFVVVLIGRAAWKILRQTGSVLVDTAPYPPEKLESLIHDVPQIDKVVRARSRGSSDAAYIDIDVQVPPRTTANHTAAIAQDIRDRLTSHLDGIQEVEVHFVPADAYETTAADIARTCSDALGIPAHEIRMNGIWALELHVEVPAGLTLASAHEQVSRLEEAIQARLPHLRDVITHIEPASDKDNAGESPYGQGERKIKEQAITLLQEHHRTIYWHHLRVYHLDGGLALTLHATFPPQMTIDAAHDLAENAEILLRAQLPALKRVTIHTEPEQ